MATLTEWPLPPAPAGHYPLLLTRERRRRVYFTRTGTATIVELSLRRTRNLREWVIPPTLIGAPAGSPVGVAQAADRRVWASVVGSPDGRLLALDPTANLLTAFSNLPGGPTSWVYWTTDVALDESGRVWYTAVVGPTYAAIGRLDPATADAVTWLLPSEFQNPNALWVESPEVIWFVAANPYLAATTGAFLARLDTTAGSVEYWALPPLRPFNFGIAGDPPGEPLNIWFAYLRWTPAGLGHGRVFRLHLPTGVFYAYTTAYRSPPLFQPYRIDVDGNGDAWVAEARGRIRRIRKDDDCGAQEFERAEVRVDRLEGTAQIDQEEVRPTVRTSVPTTSALAPAAEPCFEMFPSIAAGPFGVAVTDATAGVRPRVYFTNQGSNAIGRLLP